MRRPAVALVGVLLGATLLACGGWIHAKAALAQVLLDRAWRSALAGYASPRPWPWADTSPVARLRVPRLGIDQIVLSGAGGATLAFAPGHVDGTALPGDVGHSVVAGHRDTHFRFLRELRVGDRLSIERADGAQRLYQVRRKRVTDQHDAEVLDPLAAAPLVLVTCFPFDTPIPGGPGRYVVELAWAESGPDLRPRSADVPRIDVIPNHHVPGAVGKHEAQPLVHHLLVETHGVHEQLVSRKGCPGHQPDPIEQIGKALAE
jgi:sortase A